MIMFCRPNIFWLFLARIVLYSSCTTRNYQNLRIQNTQNTHEIPRPKELKAVSLCRSFCAGCGCDAICGAQRVSEDLRAGAVDAARSV